MRLKAHDLDFSYEEDKKVLKDIHITAEEGEIVALVGPNGSGKTTLLRCLADFHTPEKGEVKIDGMDIKEYTLNEKARKLGYVPQIENISFPSTVFDTVLMGRKPYVSWKPSDQDRRIVSDLLEKLELSRFAMREVNELSGGQRQKVFIARALAQKPMILLLDEPTSNLDLKHQLEVLDIIQQQKKKGISSIIAIHDLNLAIRYSDRIVMLKEGEVYASGGMEVVSAENIEDVYDVEVHIGEHQGWMIVTPDKPL
ncbi:MAG: ABC transporter ATP-binding protein [Candidatus Thermoplasmatota archaeon]|nr:ABC transporter ATP-binding protein [Candidatus Thermoplasmatota archaeon]